VNPPKTSPRQITTKHTGGAVWVEVCEADGEPCIAIIDADIDGNEHVIPVGYRSGNQLAEALTDALRDLYGSSADMDDD